ncbi:MAG: ATP-grasp domain-containing protein [Pantoea ananatis]|uniref:ATP-grasp domain-containing protein n=1 Tax=Pantoea ananas TaxID=553 RepID=UPI0013B9AD4B|nr:ATP-grasp domain-containing protein [Pantoea ananatis]MCW1834047.1 ATP-grasp domain-containing protein [Pantoea ananatis]NEK83747.1 ATP-grasp domain-containing protein [Pantoea ananatis]
MYKICFLGSGELLLDRAKSLGIFVALIQKQESASLEAIHRADSVLMCDYDNPDNKALMLNFIRGQGIDKVLTLSEKALNAAAMLNDSLSGKSEESCVCNVLKNKILMRNKLRGTRFGNVAFLPVSTSEELHQAALILKYPFILKPACGVGSEHVRLISDEAALASVSLDQVYTAEQFIGGKEYSVEAFSQHGMHTVHAITEKSLFKNENARFVEQGHTVARVNNEGAFFSSVEAFIAEFLDVIGIRDGATHTEIKIDEGTIYIIESHNRVGGDSIPELVYHSTGTDLYMLVIQAAAGLPLDNTRKPVVRDSGIRFFDFKPGVVRCIYGEQSVKLLPFVKDVFLPKLSNVAISGPVDSFSRHGYVICSSPDNVSLCLDRCMAEIQVSYN